MAHYDERDQGEELRRQRDAAYDAARSTLLDQPASRFTARELLFLHDPKDDIHNRMGFYRGWHDGPRKQLRDILQKLGMDAERVQLQKLEMVYDIFMKTGTVPA